jgi:hypothetical protein
MTIGRGRARRPDDWPSSHVRARADLSERLDAPLDPAESGWLETHLAACPDCRTIADAYAAQRLELRALRDRMPPPPRDLWARTAAAIESESRFRDGRARSMARGRRSFAPSALLATALVVAVAVGVLTSSQWLPGGGDAGPASPGVALATDTASGAPAGGGGTPDKTPIPAPRTFAYVSRDSGGEFSLTVRNVDAVCPEGSKEPCGTDAVVQRNPVNLDQDAASVFGSSDNARLIVVNEPTASKSGTISVVSLKSSPPAPTPTPTPSAIASPPPASPSPSVGVSPSVRPSTTPASGSPSPSSPASPSTGPTPSVAVTPAPDGSIEIAHDVILVGQSAAYSASGRWFAFTARPADGSGGPDIYVWKVGDALANRVTSDERSVFGSWSGDVMVGSTVVAVSKGGGNSATIDLEPASFLLDPATGSLAPLPQTGKAWRPAVDPSGRRAVYWAGSVRTTSVPGFAPDAGRLVLGDWSADTATSTGSAAPTQLTGDQVALRHETTIAAGRMDDWDARWDSSGTHLAVWIVDARNPDVGRLSLYAVDSFNGRIDLKNPLLDAHLASAGYSISDGKLVWAEPAADGSATAGKIQLLAWTDEGVGTVETVTGPVIVIR